MNQLKFILPDLYLSTSGANILLRGPSGYGKTTLALEICGYLSGSCFEFYLANSSKFRFKKRVVFIDEVHRLSDFEFLYPIMDLNKFVFVFATNQDGNLPEAFSNRCYEFILDNYTDDALILITKEACNFKVSNKSLLEIVRSGNNNPRIIKSICSRLSAYFRVNSISNTEEIDYTNLIRELFNIENGLDTLCQRYLEVLNNVGGTSSLSLLKSILHVDDFTLKNAVEPVLISKNLIKITSKGRTVI
jgi:Holliday junction resolvasome RuvABC ATP-dependent DNA helicase subunit